MPKVAKESTSEDRNLILRLIQEEARKLEYVYKRNCRLNPLQKPRNGPEPMKILADKIKADKRSISTDLASVLSRKFGLQDKENIRKLRKLLAAWDIYEEVMKEKLLEIRTLQEYNRNILRDMTKLMLVVESHRRIAAESIDLIQARKDAAENKLYQVQCQVNKMMCDGRHFKQDILHFLLLDRRRAHSHRMNRIVEIGTFRNQSTQLVTDALAFFKFYELAKKEAEEMSAQNRENNFNFLFMMYDLNRALDEMNYFKQLNNIRQTSRADITQDDEKETEIIADQIMSELQREIQSAEKYISELKQSMGDFVNFSPTFDADFICRVYKDVEEVNFVRSITLCEVENASDELRRDMIRTIAFIEKKNKSGVGVQTEMEQNVLKAQAYSYYLTEQLQAKQVDLDVRDMSLSALLSTLMGSFRLLSGFSESLQQFLNFSEKEISKTNLSHIFHFMEQRIEEYKYEKNYLQTRKDVEISKGYFPKSDEEVQETGNQEAAAGGIIIPDIFVAPVTVSIGEELEAIMNSFGKVEPILLEEAMKSARNEINKMKYLSRRDEEEDQRHKELTQKNKEAAVEEEAKISIRRDLVKKALEEKQIQLQQEAQNDV